MSWADAMNEAMEAKEAAMAAVDPDAIKAQLVFMGTGAACGVPTYYCKCKACEEARIRPEARRTCSSIVIARSEVTLIDTAPETHLQLEREGFDELARVLYTHEHFDHVGGLPQLEYLVRLKTQRKVPIYCNSQTFDHISTHFEGMLDTLDMHQISPGDSMEFDGITYTAIAAAHCPGALGYVIDVPARYSNSDRDVRVAYMPDTSRPSAQTLDAIRGADILVIDATFNGGNWMPGQHLSVDDSFALAQELEVGEAYLTHLSMQFDNPITLEELDAKLAGSNVHASRDGLHILL